MKNNTTSDILDTFETDFTDTALEILNREFPNWQRGVFDEYSFMSRLSDEFRTMVCLDAYASCVDINLENIDFDSLAETVATETISLYFKNN